jgi:hypothetical protein
VRRGALSGVVILLELPDVSKADTNRSGGKNGKVIPVKVQISEGRQHDHRQDAPGPVTIAVSRFASCSTIAGSAPVVSYGDVSQSSAGTNQFNFDPASQASQYGLDTVALGS